MFFMNATDLLIPTIDFRHYDDPEKAREITRGYLDEFGVMTESLKVAMFNAITHNKKYSGLDDTLAGLFLSNRSLEGSNFISIKETRPAVGEESGCYLRLAIKQYEENTSHGFL